MTDEIKSTDKASTGAQPSQRQVSVNAQYIKDFSFENPAAPASLLAANDSPKMEVSIDIEVKRLQESSFEVSLIVGANATREDKQVFLLELSYGGIFTLGVPEEEEQAILMVYCPSLLFPFARQIIADTTRNGGFPPLMLDPIDFAALYQQHRARAEKEEVKEESIQNS